MNSLSEAQQLAILSSSSLTEQDLAELESSLPVPGSEADKYRRLWIAAMALYLDCEQRKIVLQEAPHE